jgi:hypothetical protein
MLCIKGLTEVRKRQTERERERQEETGRGALRSTAFIIITGGGGKREVDCS